MNFQERDASSKEKVEERFKTRMRDRGEGYLYSSATGISRSSTTGRQRDITESHPSKPAVEPSPVTLLTTTVLLKRRTDVKSNLMYC
jgi:hypothetical protein